LLPHTWVTVIVMLLSSTTFSPGFLLSTSMTVLRDRVRVIPITPMGPHPLGKARAEMQTAINLQKIRELLDLALTCRVNPGRDGRLRCAFLARSAPCRTQLGDPDSNGGGSRRRSCRVFFHSMFTLPISAA
jgi:hypothetical protein